MSKLKTLQGGCLCGNIRFEIEALSDQAGHCHCESCRKATGSAFATFIWVTVDKLNWQSELPASYRSSEIASRGFCKTCGTTIYFQYDEERSKGLDIHAGSLDDPSAIEPQSHVWWPGHVKWLALADDLPRHERNSPESDVQI